MKFLGVLFVFLIMNNLANSNPEDFGYLLKENKEFSIWYAEGTYKIFKDKKMPKEKRQFVYISCAKNEYEPIQVVINPKSDLRVEIEISDLKNADNKIIKKENIEINVVEYVEIKKPTDFFGKIGLYPDPLPPYKNFTEVKKGEN